MLELAEVEEVQDRLIWEVDVEVAVRPAGVEGGVVSVYSSMSVW